MVKDAELTPLYTSLCAPHTIVGGIYTVIKTKVSLSKCHWILIIMATQLIVFRFPEPTVYVGPCHSSRVW